MKPRERTAQRVNAKLIEKFVHFPAIKRIHRHRQVPKHVYNAKNELRASLQAAKRKYVRASSVFRTRVQPAFCIIAGSSTCAPTRSVPSRKYPSERKSSSESKSDDPVPAFAAPRETRCANEHDDDDDDAASFVCVYDLHNSCDGPFAFRPRSRSLNGPPERPGSFVRTPNSYKIQNIRFIKSTLHCPCHGWRLTLASASRDQLHCFLAHAKS